MYSYTLQVVHYSYICTMIMGLHTRSKFDRFDNTLRISFFSLVVLDSVRVASLLYSCCCSSVSSLHLAEDTLFFSERLDNACAFAKQTTMAKCNQILSLYIHITLCTPPIMLSKALAKTVIQCTSWWNCCKLLNLTK